MITRKELYSADVNKLLEIKQDLVISKMKMDKFFSIFLDNATLDENNTNSPEWHTYKTMLTDYRKTEDLIKATDYFIKVRS